MNKLQALRGMSDLLPDDSPLWQYLESQVSELLHAYGYRELRFPIMEATELFKRSIGEVTDIVEKEMYTFLDRNEDSVTLRPEGTAGCLRACEQHQLLYNRGNLVQKLWYAGPMFRYEKPQKGRLRQFHQIGVETFGLPGPDIDAELMLMTARLWRQLGIADSVRLQINSLGSSAARARFKKDLVSYLTQHRAELDVDSQRRLDTNPLRILDSKEAKTQALLHSAPNLMDYLDDAARLPFEKLQSILDAAGVAYAVNSRLVRGLDYYGKTVFEWVTDRLGAQGTVCAGGRYDALVEQLGGRPTPAIGFAMGVERLVLLMQTLEVIPAEIYDILDIYIVAMGDLSAEALALAETLRDALPYLRIQTHCGGGNFKNQMKKADKSGAHIAVILGEDELANNSVSVKYLRSDHAQTSLSVDELIQQLSTTGLAD